MEFSNRGVLEQPPAFANMMIAQQYLRDNASLLHVLESSPLAITDSDDNNQILDLLFLASPQSGNTSATATGSIMLRAVNTRKSAVTVDVSLRGGAVHCKLLAENLPLDCVTLACTDQAVNSWSSPGVCRPKPLPVLPVFTTAEHSGTTHAQHSCGVLTLSVPPLSFTVCSTTGANSTVMSDE